jgi:hypothetical protein
MPAVTIFLSRLIGVVALIIGAAMLADKATVVAAAEHLGQDRSYLLLLGFLRVVAGAAIVLVHNVWTRGFWPLVVTLTGWAALMRGVINLFLPPEIMASLFAATHVVDFYYVYALVPLVLGAYLALRGFIATAPPIRLPTAPVALPSPPKLPANRSSPPAKPRPRKRR